MVRKVKLKDVVMRVKDKIDKDTTDLEFYVGGEHIDSGEISITKKGRIEGSTIGPAFHMHFMPGDVLLMSRNPHLKKAGVVDFEGICSDVSYICRTKDENVLSQQYLPFIFQTDHFWQFVEENKKGGLPFFLNWSDFEKYEFMLPNIDKQNEMANILWAAQNTKLAYIELLNQTDELVKSRFIELFGNPMTNDKHWPTKKMKDVAPPSPYAGEISKNANGYWLLNLDMVESNSGRIIEKVYVAEDEIGQSTTTFSSQYVLYSKLRPYLNKVVVPDGDGYATTELIPLLPNQQLLTQLYLAQLLRGDEFLTYISTQVSGTKMPRVTMNVFWEFDVMLPPLELQEQFADFVKQVDKSKFEIKKSIENISELIKSLMQQDFTN